MTKQYEGRNTKTIYNVVYEDDKGALLSYNAASCSRSWWTKGEIVDSLTEIKPQTTIKRKIVIGSDNGKPYACIVNSEYTLENALSSWSGFKHIIDWEWTGEL